MYSDGGDDEGLMDQYKEEMKQKLSHLLQELCRAKREVRLVEK